MSVDTEYKVLPNPSEELFFLGLPCQLLGEKENENIINAKIIGIPVTEYYNWMKTKGAIDLAVNEVSGFVLYAFTDKKQASKVAKELTKLYLKYRMNKQKENK